MPVTQRGDAAPDQAGKNLGDQAAARAHEMSSARLFDDYFTSMKSVAQNMGKDMKDVTSAAQTDRETLKLLDSVIKDGHIDPKAADDLKKNLKADQAGDIEAGGKHIAEGRAMQPSSLAPDKDQGMDGKNAAADAKAVADAKEILQRGIGPDGKKLSDDMRKAIEDNLPYVARDGANSRNDIPLEARYYKNDQRLLDAIKSGNVDAVRGAAAAVIADRQLDIKNEVGDAEHPSSGSYLANDRGNQITADRVVKLSQQRHKRH
jgi:hypothetical protein